MELSSVWAEASPLYDLFAEGRMLYLDASFVAVLMMTFVDEDEKASPGAVDKLAILECSERLPDAKAADASENATVVLLVIIAENNAAQHIRYRASSALILFLD